MAVTADQIRDTAIRLDGQIIRTPMLEAPMLSRNLGCDLFLKLECLQHTSSFKARGALNAMLGLNDEQRRLGVIAMSAGNHAQAVAYHAEHMGIPATIVMPAQTPFAKVARTRAFGAKVVLEGRNLNECEGTVNALIQEHGLTLIHPYDNELVMMGQGTASLEMLTDQPDLDILVVPIGGGGLMGGGISMNFANVGVPVTIVETSQEALDRGLGTIRKNYENTARKGRLTEEAVEQRCGLIQGTLDMADLADCDLIIEAVFENMAVKKDIFTRLDAIAKQGAILASNTSALDLNEIASVTSRPESVIGLHFFSPANVMKLLEVVRGEKTSDDVIKTSMALAKRIRKVAVLVGVCPGFVGNRILFPRQIEASKLALEGAPIEQVDKVLFDFGFPMGAFQMGDLAGLDLGWDKDNSNPMDVKDRLCELGRRGQKTAAGYYDYDEKRMPTPAPVTAELFAEVAAAQGVTQGDISDEEILDRCLLPMINEGAKILEEGIAVRASDIDVTYVYGYGWPVYRGGPMHYANSMGLDKVLAKIRHYHESTGDDFWAPSPLLVSLAEQGKRFK